MDYLLPDDDTMEKMAAEYAAIRRNASVLSNGEKAERACVDDIEKIAPKATAMKNKNNETENEISNGSENSASNDDTQLGSDLPRNTPESNDETSLTEQNPKFNRRVRNTRVILMLLRSLRD